MNHWREELMAIRQHPAEVTMQRTIFQEGGGVIMPTSICYSNDTTIFYLEKRQRKLKIHKNVKKNVCILMISNSLPKTKTNCKP